MMLGHLMEWFYSGIGGIKQSTGSASYKKIIIYPGVVGDLKWAETTYKTIYGDIISNWKIEKNNIIMKVKIPVNCTAIVSIPQTNPNYIFENEILINQIKTVKILEVSSHSTLLEIPSGEYNFRAHFKK
jgi:hypothetical protein